MGRKLADQFMSFPQGLRYPYWITLTRFHTGSTLQDVRWFPDDRIEWSLGLAEQLAAEEGWDFHAERIDKDTADVFEQNKTEWFLYMCQDRPFYIEK